MFFSAAIDFSSRMQDGAITYGVCVVTGLVMAFLGLSVMFFNAKPDKQKKAAYRILFVSIFFFLVGAFFKSNTGQVQMLVLPSAFFSFVFLFLFTPYHKIQV